MGPKYEHFKFKNGDLVQQVVAAEHPGRKMMVIELLYQECPGGVQLHATCSQIGGHQSRFLECELQPYAPNEAETQRSEWHNEDITARLLRKAKRAEIRKASEESQSE